MLRTDGTHPSGYPLLLPWPKPCASPFLFPVVPQGLLDFVLMALCVISWWLLVVSYPGLLIWQMPLQPSISPCCRSLALSSIHLVMLPSSKQGLEKSVRDFQVTACDFAVISLILTLCSLCMYETFKKMPLNLRPGAFRAWARLPCPINDLLNELGFKAIYTHAHLNFSARKKLTWGKDWIIIATHSLSPAKSVLLGQNRSEWKGFCLMLGWKECGISPSFPSAIAFSSNRYVLLWCNAISLYGWIWWLCCLSGGLADSCQYRYYRKLTGTAWPSDVQTLIWDLQAFALGMPRDMPCFVFCNDLHPWWC